MARRLHYAFDVPRGRQRFRELIIYIAGECENDQFFGATKLNKILFNADFRAFERFGQPLTGMRYFKLPKGPAPRALVPVVGELVQEGALKPAPPQDEPFEQRRIVALRKPYLDHFTRDELDVVDEVIKELWNKSATAVSDESHGVAWRARNMRDDIPYEAVFLADLPATPDDIVEARELNERYGWGLRV
ncbi:MAG TPA: Panacea domain-containing protein [Allosphingosinicella sp.]|jgi:hypothetical protein|nr:Panacea domain-containing protein [Allosphingosinicella sp.]